MSTGKQPTSTISIGIVLFPDLTLLDVAGPYEVFNRMPGKQIHLVAASTEPVAAEGGLTITSHTQFDNAPPFDILFVPGGPGQQGVMEDEHFLAFLREKAEAARLITSVCTGSLLLGAAGLLQGYRATTHWRYLELLGMLGAQPVSERVVIDRNRITGAGVSAGIDLALVIASILFGETVAQEIQLMIEYDPRPPFHGGSPKSADDALVRRVSAATSERYESRRRQIENRVQ